MQRGPRVWHAAHPRMHGARLRGIPAGFFHRSLSPALFFLRRRRLRASTSFRRDGPAPEIGKISAAVISSLRMCKSEFFKLRGLDLSPSLEVSKIFDR